MTKIILISGWATNSALLTSLMDGLLDADNVSSLSVHDLPQSSHKERLSQGISVYASGLINCISKMQEDCILAGWSMGGIVALEAAPYIQKKISGLVLISASAKFCSGGSHDTGKLRAVVRAMSGGLLNDSEKVLSGFFNEVAQPIIIDAESMSRNMASALAIGIDELREGLKYLMDIDLRDSLNEIEAPTLVMHGERDVIIPWQAGKYLSDNIPNSSWSLFENAGHDLPVRQSELVKNRIAEFFKSNSLSG